MELLLYGNPPRRFGHSFLPREQREPERQSGGRPVEFRTRFYRAPPAGYDSRCPRPERAATLPPLPELSESVQPAHTCLLRARSSGRRLTDSYRSPRKSCGNPARRTNLHGSSRSGVGWGHKPERHLLLPFTDRHEDRVEKDDPDQIKMILSS